jgi:hypothetical protein
MIVVAARREDDVENNVRKMGIVNWKQVAQDTDRWTETTETLVLPGNGSAEEEYKPTLAYEIGMESLPAGLHPNSLNLNSETNT